MPPKPSIQIIVPCYNPSESNWAKNLHESYLEFVEQSGEKNTGLILINDGSTQNITDNDIAFLKEKITNFRYLQHPKNKGKGYTLRQGVKEANAPYIILTDIDFPYTTSSMIDICNTLKKGPDMAVGYRNQQYYTQVPWGRKVISKILRWFLDNILRLPTNDSQCGLKGFNQQGKTIFLETTINRFLFDLEFLMLAARRKNINIQTVNVQLKEGIVFSKMNPKVLLQESLNFIKIYFKMLLKR